MRAWQKGAVIKASQWAMKLAREGFQIPIPQGVLDRLAKRVDDPSVRDLQLQAKAGDRLTLSGLKFRGIWVSFSATFAVTAPGAQEPPQSLALDLQSVQPFFARGAILSALEELEGVTVNDPRVLIDFGELIARNKWGKKVPSAMRSRLRITEAHSEEGRLWMRVGVGGNA